MCDSQKDVTSFSRVIEMFFFLTSTLNLASLMAICHELCFIIPNLFLFSELFSVTKFQFLTNYIKLFLPLIKKVKSVGGVYREADSNNLKRNRLSSKSQSMKSTFNRSHAKPP